MFTVTIISVGKKSNDSIALLCAEYEKRLSQTCHLIWKIVEPEAGKMILREQKDRESQRIAQFISKEDTVILLDETGREYNNQEFAMSIDLLRQESKKVLFVIGGAYGVSPELKNRSNYVWSLSKLVFPHQIVRLLLCEQLYRSFSILNRTNYHHE